MLEVIVAEIPIMILQVGDWTVSVEGVFLDTVVVVALVVRMIIAATMVTVACLTWKVGICRVVEWVVDRDV